MMKWQTEDVHEIESQQKKDYKLYWVKKSEQETHAELLPFSVHTSGILVTLGKKKIGLP